jgi:hypothetical protein
MANVNEKRFGKKETQSCPENLGFVQVIASEKTEASSSNFHNQSGKTGIKSERSIFSLWGVPLSNFSPQCLDVFVGVTVVFLDFSISDTALDLFGYEISHSFYFAIYLAFLSHSCRAVLISLS